MACNNVTLINLLLATAVTSSLLLIFCVQPSTPETRTFPIGRPLQLYTTGRSLNQLRSHKYPKTHFKKYPLSWSMGLQEGDIDAIPIDNSVVGNEGTDGEDSSDSKVKLEDEKQNPDDPLLLLLESYPQLGDNDWDMRGPLPHHETMSVSSQWVDLQDGQQENPEVVPAELPKVGNSDARKKRVMCHFKICNLGRRRRARFSSNVQGWLS